MVVRAKFKVRSVEETPNAEGAIIVLEPVINGSPENEQFFKWTPWGELRMGTVNMQAAAQFIPGKEFYVDFTQASA